MFVMIQAQGRVRLQRYTVGSFLFLRLKVDTRCTTFLMKPRVRTGELVDVLGTGPGPEIWFRLERKSTRGRAENLTAL